jgi:hypothetical protein
MPTPRALDELGAVLAAIWAVGVQSRVMHTTHRETTESAIWGRLLGPASTILSPEVARAILQIDFPQSDKDRMHELAKKARQGTLTQQEQDEIDSYGRIGSFLSIMKSKARVVLREKGNGARA